MNRIYTELQEQEEAIEEASTHPTKQRSKRKTRQQNSRVLPKVERKPSPEELNHEIDNVIEVLMEVEERLPLDCINIYGVLENWIRTRRTDLIQALAPK